MLRTNPEREQLQTRRIDLEKMLRFSRWWFSKEAKQEIRDEQKPSDNDSDRRSTA